MSITRRASARLFTVRSHLRLSGCEATIALGGEEERGEVVVGVVGVVGGGGDLIGINYASPHGPAVLLIHERDERKMRRERE